MPSPARRRASKTIGRNVLVVAQVALSMVLLVAAGMLVDGFRRSESLQPGFRTDHLMTMSLDSALAGHTEAQTHDFYRDLVDRARALPGVVSVALTNSIPLGELWREAVVPERYQLPRGKDDVSLLAAVVDRDFFETMNIEIVRGRAFTADDKDGSRRVAIVNEAFARTYWPNQDPIGKRLRLADNQGAWLEVVGLTKTSKYANVSEPADAVSLPALWTTREAADVDARPDGQRRCVAARGATARPGTHGRRQPAGQRPTHLLELLPAAGDRRTLDADAGHRRDGRRWA